MKNPEVYIEDILESIDKIQEYTDLLSEEEFYKDSQVQDAVLRRISVIGEAVKNIPSDFKELHQDIPWIEIAGMRDVVIHQYSGVELRRVWLVIKKDIPELKDQIQNLKID